MLFHRKQMDPGWFVMFDYLKAYASNYDINYIDLSKLEEPDRYLRDTIHTNDLGSKKYGEIIYKQFYSMNFKNKINTPRKNKWSKIYCLDSKLIAQKHIVLKSFGCSSIVGVLQNVGPYTGSIKYLNQNQSYAIQLKDQWSERYERLTIKLGINDFRGELAIEIPNNEKLVWEKLFYIGDEVKIVDYS